MANKVKLEEKCMLLKLVVGLLVSVTCSSPAEISQKGHCDLFRGEWIQNPSPPTYTNTSCNFMDERQNCMKNGRPDTGYLFWRWKPHNCSLPPFDPKKFLNSMRDKSWAMVGDSLL